MRLCFGTFATVLCLCQNNNLSNQKNLVGALTRTIDPECKYEKSPPTVSKLLKCQQNFSGQPNGKEESNRLTNIIFMAQNANNKDVAQKIESDVLRLIDEDKKKKALLALLNIIRKDTTIDNEKKKSFEKYFGKTKNALLSQDEYILSDFLTSILLYTLVEVKNIVGKGGVTTLTNSYIDNITVENDKIQVWDSIQQKFEQSQKYEPDNAIQKESEQTFEARDSQIYDSEIVDNALISDDTIKTVEFVDNTAFSYNKELTQIILEELYSDLENLRKIIPQLKDLSCSISVYGLETFPPHLFITQVNKITGYFSKTEFYNKDVLDAVEFFRCKKWEDRFNSQDKLHMSLEKIIELEVELSFMF